MISLIACVDKENGIGRNGTIPWLLPPDMKRFKELTTGSTVVMGRRTWESIGSKPLPNRVNIVVTSKPHLINDVLTCMNITESLQIAKSMLRPIFIIGGTSIYQDSFPHASHVYLTRIDKSYDCDTIFPISKTQRFNCDVTEWIQYKDNIRYRFETYYI